MKDSFTCQVSWPSRCYPSEHPKVQMASPLTSVRPWALWPAGEHETSVVDTGDSGPSSLPRVPERLGLVREMY